MADRAADWQFVEPPPGPSERRIEAGYRNGLLAVGFFVDSVKQRIDVFVFGLLVEGAIQQPAGIGVGVAEDAEDFEGFG